MDFGDPEQNKRLYEELCKVFDDVPNAWHIGRKYPSLTEEEVDASYELLVTILRAHAAEGFEKGCDFFVVDQFYGDRTHKIEVMQSFRFSWSLIDQLQNGLRSRFPLWRIAVVCDRLPNVGIWIHPEQVTCDDAVTCELSSWTPASVLDRCNSAD